jgi:hypothetical protein
MLLIGKGETGPTPERENQYNEYKNGHGKMLDFGRNLFDCVSHFSPSSFLQKPSTFPKF